MGASVVKRKVEPMRPYICDYCNSGFVREESLINHMCEKKRRWVIKDQKYVTIAFYAWQEFYRFNYSRKKEYKEFINSRYYIDFIKFGKHLTDINVIEPYEFITFILKTNVKLKDWCKEWVYDSFVRYQTERESYDKAIERNILLMQQWAIQYKEHWANFFVNISTPLAVAYIKSGRLSPWVLYNSKTGMDLLERMSDEELGIVSSYINPKQWQKKFDKYPEEVDFIKKICKKAGV